MRNMIVKVLIIITILSMLILIFNIESFAADEEQFKIDLFENKTTDGKKVETKITNALGTVLAVTRVIVMGIAIVMLIVLAMKYMISSAGERAEIKKYATTYVVGALVLFAASGILAIIEEFSTNIS